MGRTLKDGWPIYREWVEYEDYVFELDIGVSVLEEDIHRVDAIYDVIAMHGVGKRTHWVLTDCYGCGVYMVSMPLSELVARGPDDCDGCEAYRAHTNPY